ncbi:MAG: dTMP kinase [Candidatus Yanofskybacteria bacterium RIFCSPHIGHO2_01_FULL_42_12]|uniref:Thymidylate kinase n=1 Tax=Candidatus Yanofskybacteria bacterium RIFCSPLOWO2_01_FULL_42_49 TaxID=1802694 RepID=A0A1F8GAZ9_9BACT|nr:MAG: dTMP kinase [Candidatus Yanofskybacteria bacterium RIFCSPHIGHO2_01_FULL_42_12]OGN22562.1 MAG: dTMP kinase [Candidatus Yanofskybacteria bacterium RIFCSPLOWO2_01_FULL_42_49]
MSTKGVLVAIEGIDGSGKSTQCKLLKERLEKAGFPATIVKAKNDKQGRVFKNFLSVFGITADSVSFTLLYQALHRRQFEIARNELGKKHIVVADRWNPSFFVFHNLYGLLADKPQIRESLDKLAFENLRPDICFLLNVPVKVSFTRRSGRKNEPEREPSPDRLEFYEKIAAEYLRLASREGWVVIDANLPISEIHRQIMGTVENILLKRN